jgi:hypothetical protein
VPQDLFGPDERRRLYVLLAMEERAAGDVRWRESRGFDVVKRERERDALSWAISEIERLTRIAKVA